MEKLIVLLLVCGFSSLVLCRPAHQKQKRWVYEVNKDPVIANHLSSCDTALQDYVAGKITMYEYKALTSKCIHKDAEDMRRRMQVQRQPQYYNYNGYYANAAPAYPAAANGQFTQQSFPLMHGQSTVELGTPYMNAPMMAQQRSRVPVQNFNPQAQMMRQWNMQQLGSVRNQVPSQFVARFQQQRPMYANNQQ